MSRVLAALAVLVSLAAQGPDQELAAIAAWLPGTYDTFAQAAADESGGTAYRHVRAVLRITPITLAGSAPGTRAFYLEQALADNERAPYRQRVIVVRRLDGALMNELYRLKQPQPWIGFDGRATISTSDLEREPGCDAYWTRASETAFRGSAGIRGRCPSTLRGASHAVSSFVLTEDKFTTLDQGIDDAGAVQWGPPAGDPGHIFVKR